MLLDEWFLVTCAEGVIIFYTVETVVGMSWESFFESITGESSAKIFSDSLTESDISKLDLLVLTGVELSEITITI